MSDEYGGRGRVYYYKSNAFHLRDSFWMWSRISEVNYNVSPIDKRGMFSQKIFKITLDVLVYR